MHEWAAPHLALIPWKGGWLGKARAPLEPEVFLGFLCSSPGIGSSNDRSSSLSSILSPSGASGFLEPEFVEESLL